MIKKFLCVAGLSLGLQTAWGFALLGPNPGIGGGTADGWQVVTLGYDLAYLNLGVSGGGVWLGDIGGPKNIGEEYRRNVPVLYYAYNGNFSGYFGAEGETAVDGAFAIMNSLTNVDSYSSDLSEFPFQSQSQNYLATGTYLTDIKSVTLHLLVEQLGLTEPERYTWTLHDRFVGTKCPVTTTYLVVQRNFDITTSPLNQIQYSAYVNNVLYTYFIEEDCGRIPGIPWNAITVPHGQDPLAQLYTAVAANNYAGEWTDEGAIDPSTGQILVYSGGLQIGGFYTGLTRDDVGGLRYLMSTNNMNWETAAAGSLLVSSSGGGIGGVTYGPPTLLYTSNYTTFWLTAQTTSPATLSNLFPGLVIVNSSYYYTNIVTPNIVTYTTNLIGSPYGEQVIVVTTNGVTSNLEQIFSYSFANLDILTNEFSPNTSASLVEFSIMPQINAPYGSPLATNTTTKTIILTNVPSGEYFINTNYLCGPPLFQNLLATIVTPTTNFIFSASNSVGEVLAESLVIYSTTHVYQVEWPICSGGANTNSGGVANATGYYQGIQRVQFVRVPDTQVDPLTGNFLQPIISFYTNVFFNPTNRQLQQQIFQRVVARPDILLSAQDLAVGPAGNNFVGTVTRPVPQYEIGNSLPGLAGPGIIDGSTTFTFNKVGPVFYNGPFPDTNGFTDLVNEMTQVSALQWASFDGSTNLPVLYPNGTSIQELESQLVISILPASLPDGTNNVVYPTTQFSATGGQPGYTWSLGTGTLLPAGLTFSSGGLLSGTPSGNAPGVYDFAIQLTDSQGQVVVLNYSITIH